MLLFFALYFRNNPKTAKTNLITKIEQIHVVSAYNKTLYSEHRKIIFEEVLIILSKCMLFSWLYSECVIKFYVRSIIKSNEAIILKRNFIDILFRN